MSTPTSKTEPAGRSIEAFTEAVGLSRTAFYQIPTECLPEGFKFGKKTIVTEDPKAWVARIKERGGIQTLKRGSKAAA